MNIIAMALRDIKRNYRTYIFVFFSIFFSTGMVIAIIYYSGIIDSQIKTKLQAEEPCILKITCNASSSSKIKDITSTLNEDPFIEKTKLYYSDSAIYFIPPAVYNANSKFIIDCSYQTAEAIIDNTTYKFNYFDKYTSVDWINIISSTIDNQVITNDDLICGSVLTNEKQIILPQQYLDMFGIEKENYFNLIGKNFSLYLSAEKRKIPVIKSFTIVGITSNQYYDDNNIVSPIIPYISPYYKDSISNVVIEAVVRKYDNKKINEIESTIKDKGFNIDLNKRYAEIDFFYKQKEFLDKIIWLIVCFFSTAIIFHLTIYMAFSAQQMAKASYMLIAMGMTPNEVILFRCLENSLVTIAASLLGTVIYSIFAYQIFVFVNPDVTIDITKINCYEMGITCMIELFFVFFISYYLNKKEILYSKK